jgi:phosphotransferase system enzyme I (PtsI)
MTMKYKGTSISRGIAIGTVYLYQPYISKPASNKLSPEEENEAICRYETARDVARHELENICRRLDDKGRAAIFTAHIDILYDETVDEEIRDCILGDGYREDWAIFSVYEKYLQALGKAKDALIRERVMDFKDVENRLLRCHAGIPERNLGMLEKPVIIVTHDLMPSDTATLDRNMVLGIVTEAGGMTSHSAIIARGYGIPLLCVRDVTRLVPHNDTVIVDALDGVLVVQPDKRTVNDYVKKREEWLARMEDAGRYLSVTPVCNDGTRIEVELNIGSVNSEELEGAVYTDGVGLFRTEFLYMGRSQLPSEDEQFELYKEVLSRFGKRPVTLRTLDIGGDKTLDCLQLPEEQNPFLGKRALRLSFDDPTTFKTQLRAALRASMYGDLWIMFPMVTSMDDLRRAKAIVKETQDELTGVAVAFDAHLKLGIMIEIPAIAMMADHVVREVDFASIGTNDLTQYALAVDRMNPTVSEYYQSYHPALFRLIGLVAEQFRKADKPLCVCGELAGDPLAAAVLIGLGIRRLSMGIASVASIKKLICGLCLEYAEKLAKHVLELSTAEEVERYLKAALKDLII